MALPISTLQSHRRPHLIDGRLRRLGAVMRTAAALVANVALTTGAVATVIPGGGPEKSARSWERSADNEGFRSPPYHPCARRACGRAEGVPSASQCLALAGTVARIRTISERSLASAIRSIDERRASVISGASKPRQFSENLTPASPSLSGPPGPPRLISPSSPSLLPPFVVTDRIAGACSGKMESQRGSLVPDILRISSRRIGSATSS